MHVTKSDSRSPLRVGLVAWRALPAVYPEWGQAIGGLETRAWLLARGLAGTRSVEPSLFVELDRHVRVASEREGVRLRTSKNVWRRIRADVSRHLDLSDGIRLKRFTPSLLWQVPLLAITKPWRPDDPQPISVDDRLADEMPDVWCAFGVNGDSARVIATAGKQNKPAVLFLGSNADIDERLAGDEDFINKYGDRCDVCRFAIRRATKIVCQSAWQQQALLDRFGIEGVLIRNPIDVNAWQSSPEAKGRYVLWIGRHDDFHKRVPLAIEAARKCPDIPFVLVANRHDAEVEEAVRRDVPANVELRDYVPFSEMPAVFSEARVFLSTGDPAFEGFPNVLLQAAASGTPVVSLEDFDQFLSQSQAGVLADSVDALPAAIQAAWSQTGKSLDEAVARYLKQHHDIDSVALKTLNLLNSVALGQRI